jgi:hypothetical protein
MGLIKSAWAYEENAIKFKIETPVNAVICLPDGICHEVDTGKYEFSVALG